jgi:glycosyltransferase involved in cell wall biosynthesis
MNSAVKDISIIIPCYNTAPAFIREAIESVKNYQGNYSYDIIIVDDGSTNPLTKTFLGQINDNSIKVFYRPKKGPAAARNYGVQQSGSEFILFLDSDDRIKPAFIDRGIQALKEEATNGVAYSNAIAFGDGSRKNFTARPFDIRDLLIQNYIPMCSVLRRKAWEDVCGIDENLIQYEDWEFWIRIYKAGWKFIFLKEEMFEYRIQNTSLIAADNETKFRQAVEYIFKKHWDLVYGEYHHLYGQEIIYQNDQQKPFRSFIKYCRNKFLKNS